MAKKEFSPETWEELSYDLSEKWNDMQDEIIGMQVENLTKGANNGVDKWYEKQLKQNRIVEKSVLSIIKKHKDDIDFETDKAYLKANEVAQDLVKERLGEAPEIDATELIENKIEENEEVYKYLTLANVKAKTLLVNKTYALAKLKMSKRISWTLEEETKILYDAMERTVDQDLSKMIGVTYKNGRQITFRSYMEMRIRTDINHVAIDMMEDASNRLGVVLFLCNEFGTCADDHRPYQGKVYVLENWRNLVSSDKIDKYTDYIQKNDIQTLESIKGAPVYLGTRPNCRHTFTPITFEQATNKNQTLKDLGLSAKGKANKEKYEASQKQRAYERAIRDYKLKYNNVLIQAKSVNNDEVKLKLLEKAKKYRGYISYFQKQIRELLANNSYLARDYARENINKATYDLGANYNKKG